MTAQLNESNIVKKALRAQGITARVTHGNGTACGWLHIYIRHSSPHPDGSEALRLELHGIALTAVRIAQQATGRHGEYDGRINTYCERIS